MAVERTAEWNELRRLCDLAKSFDPALNVSIKAKAESRLRVVDAMAPEFRDAVNRHGLGVVQAFIDHGVKSAKSIDYLVDCVRNINDGRPANFGNHRVKSIRRMGSAA